MPPTLHPGVSKHTLQYDWRFGVWVGTWNLCSLNVCRTEKEDDDVCCLQVVREEMVLGCWG